MNGGRVGTNNPPVHYPLLPACHHTTFTLLTSTRRVTWDLESLSVSFSPALFSSFLLVCGRGRTTGVWPIA